MSEKIIALVQDDELKQPIEKLAAERNFEVIWHLELKGVVKSITELRPLLILVDLRNKQSKWFDIVRALKTNTATRRLAVIGFARFLDHALREKASAVFIEEIIDAYDDRKGGVLTTLPLLVNAYSRRQDEHLQLALKKPCQQPMPPLVLQGLQEFNAGEYYEAHETLEHAWMDEEGPVRNVYRAILQVGVAYYQIQRQNYWGAIKMFLRAVQWLEPLPDTCHGIDIQQFRDDTRAVRQALESLGPEQISQFDPALFKPVMYRE